MSDDKARAEQAAREILKYGKHGGQLQCICAACEENVREIILRAIRLARADEAEWIGRVGILSAEPRKQMCDRRAAELRRLAEGK